MKAKPLGFEDEEKNKSFNKPIYLFGRDIQKIPCFRDSFIFGFWCCAGGGLLCFLFTSKALFSTHVAFASLWIGVFAYWFPCRYKYETSQIIIHSFNKQVKENQKNHENQLTKSA